MINRSQRKQKVREMPLNVIKLTTLLVLMLLIGCQTEKCTSLDGRWINNKVEWGLEFSSNTVWELDKGSRTNHGTYRVEKKGSKLFLFIEDEEAASVAFPIAFIDGSTIKV